MGAPPDLAVLETSAGVEKKANLFAETVGKSSLKHLESTVQTSLWTSLTGRACTLFLAVCYVWLRVQTGLQLPEVQGGACSLARPVGRRSVLFILGHLAHKARRAQPWELWSLLHRRRSARPPPLCINYICLRCPGVSYSSKLWVFHMTLFYFIFF